MIYINKLQFEYVHLVPLLYNRLNRTSCVCYIYMFLHVSHVRGLCISNFTSKLQQTLYNRAKVNTLINLNFFIRDIMLFLFQIRATLEIAILFPDLNFAKYVGRSIVVVT